MTINISENFIGLKPSRFGGNIYDPSAPTYNLPLKTDILPIANDMVVPGFSRSTTGTVIDFEGVVHDCQIDEVRFSGARRVENLIASSEDIATDNWNTEQTAIVTSNTFLATSPFAARRQTISTEEGVRYILSFTAHVSEGARGTGFRFRHYNSASGNSTSIPLISSTPERYEIEILGRAGGGNCTFGIYDGNNSDWVTLNITDFQLEKVSGSQTEASEYVSNGVEDYPYHGVGVDGVKCFNTDRSGDLLTSIKGYLNEPESTNLVFHSENQGNWFNTGTSEELNVETAPNGTLTADKLQVTSTSNARFYCVGIALTGIHCYSICVKKGTATWFKSRFAINGSFGGVWFDLENGVVGTEDTGYSGSIEELSDGWYKCSICFECDGSLYYYGGSIIDGDNSLTSVLAENIYVWGAQVEESPFPTSYIKTEATTVTRTADSLTVDNSDRDVLPNSFCLAGTWTPFGAGDDYEDNDIRLFGSQDSSGETDELRTVADAYDYIPQTGGSIFELTKDDINPSIENKYAIQLFQDGSDVNAKIYKDGLEKLSETETQTLDHSNESLEIGSWAGAVFASNIKDISIYSREISDSELEQLTTTIYEVDENGDILFDENYEPLTL